MKYLMMLFMAILISCSTTKDISWTVEDDYVIIQLEEVKSEVEAYYAEITLESGRRIAVEIGLPDENGKFIVKNNFGKFRNIEIYTNLDL